MSEKKSSAFSPKWEPKTKKPRYPKAKYKVGDRVYFDDADFGGDGEVNYVAFRTDCPSQAYRLLMDGQAFNQWVYYASGLDRLSLIPPESPLFQIVELVVAA